MGSQRSDMTDQRLITEQQIETCTTQMKLENIIQSVRSQSEHILYNSICTKHPEDIYKNRK